MVDATSEYSRWLQRISLRVSELTLKRALFDVSQQVWRDYHAEIWFVRITGPRWSYYAGHVPANPSAADLRLVELNDRFGLVCSALGELQAAHLDALVTFVNNLLAERHCSRGSIINRQPCTDKESAL